MADLRSDPGVCGGRRRNSGANTGGSWRARLARTRKKIRTRFRTSALAIGGDAFVDWVRDKADRARPRPNVRRIRRCARCRSPCLLTDVLGVAARMLEVRPRRLQGTPPGFGSERDCGPCAVSLCGADAARGRRGAGHEDGGGRGAATAAPAAASAADAHLRRRLASLEEALC